jgi:hypothetical protein
VCESARLRHAHSAVDERLVDEGCEQALTNYSRSSVALNAQYVQTARPMG